MAMSVADQLLERLREWGVHRIYGYPGDGINAILGALDAAGNDPELIQVRHEEMAAFMACAHAKFTGELGVCLATSGPGAIHLLNGLYDAKADHQPVLAIVGQAARSGIGGEIQQEVDLPSLFKDVAGAFVHTAVVPEQVAHLVDRAVRIALSERTVTCLIVPKDVQELDAVERVPHTPHTVHPERNGARPRPVPAEAALVGDAAATLRALLPRLREKADRGWRARVEKDVEEWWTVLEKRALRPADPMNPQRVFWELSSRLPDRCILAGDAGTSAIWMARDLRLRRGMSFSL